MEEPLVLEILSMISVGPIAEKVIYHKLFGKYSHQQISLALMEILKNEMVNIMYCPLRSTPSTKFGPQKPIWKVGGELSTFKLPKSKRH